MNIAEIVLLGAALSADAFAVTVSDACTYTHERRCRLFLMPVFFGFFQALMPCLGYVLSGLAADLIERYAGIVTLVILGIIGGNMLIEGIKSLKKEKPEDCECCGDTSQHLTVWTLILQAIATAIDAFAVGVSLRAEGVPILASSAIIGCTTFAFCIVALFIGRRLGTLLGDRAEVAGGCVLILIGLKACFL